MSGATLLHLAPTEIEPSPHNYRKTFDQIDELADSFKAHGVISPVEVRSTAGMSGNHAPYQLIAGERRLRAAKLIPAFVLPALVTVATDEEVMERQLIENSQRKDVHAIEEGDHFKRLIKSHKHTIDSLIEVTGKSRSHIYSRIKLAELPPAARDACLAGKLDASIALKIARLGGGPKVQDAATKRMLAGRSQWDHEAGKNIVEPLSFREASKILQREFMLRLEGAPFPTDDADLVKSAGACTTCPHRTGNQPTLFPDDAKSADVCTNLPCFESKKKAEWDRKTAAATREGVRVLGRKESEKVFEPWGDKTKVAASSPYIDPKEKLPYEIDPSQKKTWKSALGTATVSKAIVQDDTGATRELVDRTSALAALKKSGVLKEGKAHAKASKRPPDQYALDQAKKAREAKRRHKVARIAFAEIERKGRDASGVPYWQWLARAVLRMIDAEDCRNICKRRDIETKLGSGDAQKALAKIVLETKTVDGLIGVISEFASSYHAVGGLWAGSSFGENFTGACDVLDVDLDKIKAQVVKEEKEGKPAAPVPAPAKKKPAKKGGKK